MRYIDCVTQTAGWKGSFILVVECGCFSFMEQYGVAVGPCEVGDRVMAWVWD
jgi:hypothetical protein